MTKASASVDSAKVGGAFHQAGSDKVDAQIVRSRSASEYEGGESLRSLSLGSSATRTSGVSSELRDPVDMLSALIDKGLSMGKSHSLMLSYYEAFGRGTLLERTGVGDQAFAPSGSHSPSLVGSDYAGKCYVNVLRVGKRAEYARVLGTDPKFHEFVSKLRDGDLDPVLAEKHSVFRMQDSPDKFMPRYHIAEHSEGVRVGSFNGFVAAMMRQYVFVNRQLTPILDDTVHDIPLVGIVGVSVGGVKSAQPVAEGAPAVATPLRTVTSDSGSGSLPSQVEPKNIIEFRMPRLVPDAEGLRKLNESDFTTCWCQIHRVPDTASRGFAQEGCCKSKLGQAGVLASAGAGVNRMCHADERTRQQDKNMLDMWLSDLDPGVLLGAVREPRLASLCTSSETTNIQAFGNGYCYLRLISHDCWWRTARILGPNPPAASLLRALRWVGRPRSKIHAFKHVKGDYYHVVPVKHEKGVRVDAGIVAFRDLLELVEGNPRAKIGFNETANQVLPASFVNFVTPAFAILIACASMLVTIMALVIRIAFASRY